SRLAQKGPAGDNTRLALLPRPSKAAALDRAARWTVPPPVDDALLPRPYRHSRCRCHGAEKRAMHLRLGCRYRPGHPRSPKARISLELRQRVDRLRRNGICAVAVRKLARGNDGLRDEIASVSDVGPNGDYGAKRRI